MKRFFLLLAAFTMLFLAGCDDSSSSSNHKPVANAGNDQTANIGELIQLDGSASTDEDTKDILTYSWQFVSVPEGSEAELREPTTVSPSFYTDLAGEYVVELVVNDGKTASDPDTVTITVVGTEPDVDNVPDADEETDMDIVPDVDSEPDMDITPDMDEEPDMDTTPDIDEEPDMDEIPDVDGIIPVDSEPDADEIPDTDTATPDKIIITEVSPNYGYPVVSNIDYVKLYNPNNYAVALDGYQLAYRARNATSNYSNKTIDFTGKSIPAKGYFLIAETAFEAATGLTPDATASLALSYHGASLVLHKGYEFSTDGSCPDMTDPLILDAVSFLDDAASYGCAEGDSPLILSTPNAYAVTRYMNIDTDLTASDFTVIETGFNPVNSAGAGLPIPLKVAFADTDTDLGEIGGDIVITAAPDELNITSYNIYWGSKSTTKLNNTTITTITPAGTATYTYILPADTVVPEGATHILVYSEVSDGTNSSELGIGTSTAIIDIPILVHFLKPSEWNTPNLYVWDVADNKPLGNWPGSAMTDDGEGWYSLGIPNVDATNVIFNDGSKQTVNLLRKTPGWFVPNSTPNGEGKYEGTWYDTKPLPEIAVTNNSTDYISGSTFTFPDTVITNEEQTIFTVANTGDGSLTITGVTLGDTTNFAVSTINGAITSESTFVINPGETLNIIATFKPQTAEVLSTTLTLANNDADEASFTITLSGSGTETDPCDPNPCTTVANKTVCSNNAGSAVCSCDPGYTASGEDCIPASTEAPQNAAVSVSFADTDMTEGEIAGDITISAAADESDVVYYNLYWGTSETAKLETTPFDTISASAQAVYTSTIAENTVIPTGATHILVFTANVSGEMATGVNAAIEDMKSVTIHYRNIPGWTNVYAYAWADGGASLLGSWPGKLMTSETPLVRALNTGWFSVEVGYIDGMTLKIIFNNNNSAQTIDLDLEKTERWFVPNSTPNGEGKYEGLWYDTKPDPCDPNPCGDHGTCSPTADAYTCSCDNGYSFNGTTCVEQSAGCTSNADCTDAAAPLCSIATSTCVNNALFFSEYVEGGSFNKAVEIYNGSKSDIDLSGYTVKLGVNGAAWSTTIALSGTLAAGDVYVLCHTSIDSSVTTCDQKLELNHNGDDPIGLFFGETIIDVIGVSGSGDPGDGWSVAGTAIATKDHTLERKASVTAGNTDWIASAGTDADNSEWTVFAKDTLNRLGVRSGEIVVTDPCDPNPCVDLNKTVCSDNGGVAECSCDFSYHDDNGACVSDTQTVSCIDNAPANATSTIANVEITWDGGVWSDPADCAWSCNADYHEDNGSCVSNTQTVSCNDAAPANATSTIANVVITWDGSVWSEPADCAWACDADYHEDNGSCVSNTAEVACTGTVPTNATASNATVIVTWNTATSSWSVAEACNWTCNTGYTLNDASDDCINSKLVSCNDAAPANSTSIIENVEITWNGSVWSTPSDCSWDCNEGYVDNAEGTGCELAPLTIGWCSTQWPSTVTADAGTDTETIYGQVYVAGVTNSQAEQDSRLVARLCYSTSTDLSNPTCVEAPFDSQQSNNHQYATILNLVEGTYYYFYQVSGDTGSTWLSCDLNSSGGTDYQNSATYGDTYGTATINPLAVNPCDPNPCVDANKTVCSNDNGLAVCSCDADYHDDNGTCVSNTRTVDCNSEGITPPANGHIDLVQVTQTWNTETGLWSDATVCNWVCDTDYTLNDTSDDCINSKEESCDMTGVVVPANATVINSTVTVTYTTAGGWTSAATCEWGCDADYILNDTSDGCINSKEESCDMTGVVVPANATVSNSIVTVTYTTAGGWTLPATCVWGCDADYTLNDTSDGCINSKEESCDMTGVVVPANATVSNSTVTVTYTTAGGWTLPATCEWGCDFNYTLNDAEDGCINSKFVNCNDVAPTNATSSVVSVAVTYTTADGWTTPADCSWACDDNYDQDESTCINSKLATCTNNPPANAETIDPSEQVTITYTTVGGWSTAPLCTWVCSDNYTENDTEDACINSKTVSCTDNAPANATSTIADVTINYTSLGGWETPEDCVWACDDNYDQDDSTCISSKEDFCTDNPPANATTTDDTVIVTITYTTAGGWTTPETCPWDCNADYALNDTSDGCINSKLVSCNDVAPEHATSTIDDVTINYTTAGGWETPANCVWTCNTNFNLNGTSDGCDAVPLTIDWCSTQWPEAVTVDAGADSELVYGQVYISTQTSDYDERVMAKLCYSTATDLSNPICIDSPFDSMQGNNMQFAEVLNIATAGTYYYYYQVSGDAGSTWAGCALNSAGGTNTPAENYVPATYGTATINVATVDLTGYYVNLYQGGTLKYTYTFTGAVEHGKYFAVTRNAADLAAWESTFTTAIDSTDIFAYESSNEQWQSNDIDDEVRIYDAVDTLLDSTMSGKNTIKTRQSDNTYTTGTVHHVATGAPSTIDGYTAPLYIYEVGEAGTGVELTGYTGNYVLIYIP